jgi:hypothetical protein
MTPTVILSLGGMPCLPKTEDGISEGIANAAAPAPAVRLRKDRLETRWFFFMASTRVLGVGKTGFRVHRSWFMSLAS